MTPWNAADTAEVWDSRDEDAGYAKMLFAVAAVLVVAFSAFIIHQPVRWLAGAVPDDTFYYLQIARQLAKTGITSLDGLNSTNGYHPGWMALLAVCAKLVPARGALLRACLALSFSFHLLTSVLLVAVFRRYAGPFWAWIGGAFWMISPLALELALQGTETSFYLSALVLVLLTYTTRIEPHLRSATPFCPPARDLILFGASLGVAFWGRTEALLLALVTVTFLLGVIRLSTGTRPLAPAVLRTTLLVGGTLLLCILPWFLYSYAVVGSLIQDSGAMKMLWAADERSALRTADWARFLFGFLRWNWLGQPLALLVGMRRVDGLLSAMQIVMGLFLAGAIYLGFRARRAGAFTRVTVWLSAVLLVTGAVYDIFLNDYQIWHWGQPGLILYVISFGWGALALMRVGRGWPRAVPILCATVFLFGELFLAARFFAKTPVLYPFQRDGITSTRQFDPLVPAGTPIACFNAGIPAYFSSHPVIDLDGLVNHDVLRYWRMCTFDRYLLDAHITYIADTPDSVRKAEHYSSAPIGLAPIAWTRLHGLPVPKRWLWRVKATGSDATTKAKTRGGT